MSNEKHGYVSLTWSTSRGRESYGWNIRRLTDELTGKKYRATGGGYDMTGTVMGDWISDRFQDRLMTLAARAAHDYRKEHSRREGSEVLYGLAITKDGAAMIDGACGCDSVLKIAAAAGVELSPVWAKRNGARGYFWTVGEFPNVEGVPA